MNKTKEMAFKAINGLINDDNIGKFIKDNEFNLVEELMYYNVNISDYNTLDALIKATISQHDNDGIIGYVRKKQADMEDPLIQAMLPRFATYMEHAYNSVIQNHIEKTINSGQYPALKVILNSFDYNDLRDKKLFSNALKYAINNSEGEDKKHQAVAIVAETMAGSGIAEELYGFLNQSEDKEVQYIIARQIFLDAISKDNLDFSPVFKDTSDNTSKKVVLEAYNDLILEGIMTGENIDSTLGKLAPGTKTTSDLSKKAYSYMPIEDGSGGDVNITYGINKCFNHVVKYSSIIPIEKRLEIMDIIVTEHQAEVTPT